MASATQPRFRFASTVAKDRNITLDEVASLLKMGVEVKPRTPITPAQEKKLDRAIKAQAKTAASANGSGVSPGLEVGQALSVEDTILRTRSSKPRAKDHRIAEELQEFVEAYWSVSLPFVPADIRRQGVNFVYDSPVGGTIKLDLQKYSKYNRKQSFPFLSQQRLREVAAKMGELWCVQYHCIHCGEAIDPRLESKLKLVLRKRFALPLVSKPREMDRIGFASQHDECRLLVREMVEFELEMRDFTGTEEEEIEARMKAYGLMSGKVLPEARRKQPKLQRKDVLRRMKIILKKVQVPGAPGDHDNDDSGA